MRRTPINAFLLTVLSGLLYAFSFPSFLEPSLHPSGAFLVWVALVPLLIALQDASLRRAALLGFLWGFTAYGTLQYWVLSLKEAEYLAIPGWAALNAIIALHYALWAVTLTWVVRRLPRSGLLAAPLLWTVVEFLRTAPPVVGYPWALAGATQASDPPLLHLASVTGVWGLTFLVVWVNASLAGIVRSVREGRRDLRSDRVFLAAPALALILWGWGWMAIRQSPTVQKGTVALVQPAIDQSVKWSRAMEWTTYDKLERLTRKAAVGHPSLILWPETAAPSYLSLDRVAMERVRQIARLGGSPLLAGCLDAVKVRPGKVAQYNAATHFGPDGRNLPPYRKRHLVPFGEYVPAQKVFAFLGPVVAELGSFDEGKAYSVYPARGFTYSPLICYEAIIPGETRTALKGADVLVNISNDAWYGTTAAAYQHALLAVVRAAENGKPLLRCANTGISLATDPYGRILNHTRLFEEAVLKVPVLLRTGAPTIYARFGDWFAWLASALAVLVLFVSFLPKVGEPSAPKEAPTYPDLSKFGEIEVKPPIVGPPSVEPKGPGPEGPGQPSSNVLPPAKPKGPSPEDLEKIFANVPPRDEPKGRGPTA